MIHRSAPSRSPRSAGAVAAIAAITPWLFGCSLSPLNHRIRIGEESFVAFVGEGPDGHTDLFAGPAGGGEVVQFTYTPLIEAHPRLDSAGDVVAFLRVRDTIPGTQQYVVFMNLLSGGEVQIPVPAEVGAVTGDAWARGGTALYLRAAAGLWRLAAPPASPVWQHIGSVESAAADSALDIWLGDPPFARAITCAGGGVCVIGSRGDTAELSPTGRDPMRWGPDSVAWFDGNDLLTRSLGPGSEHRVAWTNVPHHPRDGNLAEVRPTP